MEIRQNFPKYKIYFLLYKKRLISISNYENLDCLIQLRQSL
jgi:hypothetical protein